MNAADWKQEVRGWLQRHRDVSPALAESGVLFFQRAFEHTRCVEHAWFGIHAQTVSLVVGGIFLAAVVRSGQHKGPWLLADQNPPPIEGIEYLPVRSTRDSRFPLMWAHSPSFDALAKLVASETIWRAYAQASEKILHTPRVSTDRDTVQQRRGKHRLADVWPGSDIGEPRMVPPAQEPHTLYPALLATQEQQLTTAGVFDPADVLDARDRILAAIVRRHGQPAFRRQLLRAYAGQCAISGCNVEAALDAAHIVPYKGPATNHPANGVLLRTDLHTLFDLGLIAVDTDTMCVLIAPSLAGTCYQRYSGKPLCLPSDPGSHPSREALDQHRAASSIPKRA